MKTLIAVKSCHDDLEKGCNQTIRETWGKQVPNLRFFVGCQRPSNSDINYNSLFYEQTVDLDVADDYDHLPQKTCKILNWSLKAGYDFTFLCDVDTFLIPDKLFKTDFQNYDYSGKIGARLRTTFNYKDGRGIRHPKCYTWASGGFGYFLSRKAANIIVNSIIDPNMWAEDMYVGDVLGPKIVSGEITATDLSNFENEASWHYPAHQLGWDRQKMQQWMRKMYYGL